MSNDVTFQRAEYINALPKWELATDCVQGSAALKSKTTKYLPRPNPLDKSQEAEARYADYLLRAVFYNATGRTLRGMVGLAFAKAPEFKVPSSIDYAAADIDGAGLSIYQQSQRTLAGVLTCGRFGLLVDFPSLGAAASVADMQAGGIRATVAAYDAASIINWRTERVGGIHRLSLVVLREQAEVVDDFGVQHEDQYRALRMIGGAYIVEIYRQGPDKKWFVFDTYTPLNASGRPWQEIPFIFVGAQNNDTSVDDAPLYDIAELNVAHYRNSAEYEDTTFVCGQVQPVVTGVDEHWITVLKENGVMIGSRTLFPLPTGAAFEFVQAQPNALPIEAMKHKEEKMISLGAKLIIEDGAAKTATEVNSNNSANNSVLSTACENVSAAYAKCLLWMLEFMGGSGEAVYQISRDYGIYFLDPQIITALVAAWQSGKLPEGDLWEQFRKYGLIAADKDNEKIKEELDTQASGLNLDVNSGAADGQ